MPEILMPALSPTMEEGKLAKWLVKPGDSVKPGDVLAEIETDKATMEVESVDTGTVSAILVAEGTEGVKVNTPIAIIAGEGEAAAPAPAPVAKSALAEAPAPAAAKPVAAAPVAPAPVTTWSRSGSANVCFAISASFTARSGVNSLGLNTTALPAASAYAIEPIGVNSG